MGSVSDLGVVGNSSNCLSGRPVATHFTDARARAPNEVCQKLTAALK
jgi:hypothetical protein